MEEGDNMEMKMLKSVLTFGLIILFSGTTPALAADLIPLGNGMIYGFYEDADLYENVTWLDISVGPMDYVNATAWAESLEVCGYTDWRLPTEVELQILTRRGHQITFDTPGPFASIQSPYPSYEIPYYWTSTPSAGGHRVVELVSGYGSSVKWPDTYADGYVMAVRDGMSSCAVTPTEALEDLSATVANLDMRKGIANSLNAKLDTALGALDDLNENNDVAATNALGAFIHFVEAKRGKKIAEEDADMLIQAALNIITALETP
jgi:hypothetical protein